MNDMDLKFINRCIAGDTSAWEKLYSEYAPKVKSFVSAFRLSQGETEDICQEVFLDLFKSLSSFRGEASLQSFILKIAKYRCIAFYRKNLAKKRGGGNRTLSMASTDARDFEEGYIIKDDVHNVEDIAIMKEEASELLLALERLSPDCRKIITKRYFGGFSYASLAESFHMPMGTLCSKLKRCLTYLGKIYKKINS